MDILKETDFNFLGPENGQGAGYLYAKNRLILVTTDRHSASTASCAYSMERAGVESDQCFWFERPNIVPNHVLAVPDPNVTVAKSALWCLSRR